MDFEFDPVKSARNHEKHGIDFEAAQELWRDERLLEVQAKTEDEPRFLAIGKIGGKHWTAVFTYRGSVRRIISVRRARKQETEYYESL
jgi:uncharacterized DUF497 family protein